MAEAPSAPPGSAVSDVPDDLTEITATLQETLAGVWVAFLEHTPLLVAGIVVLLLTWVVSAVFRRVAMRMFREQGLRPSLRQLIIRLINVGFWIAGTLLAAMFWFPGLTPATALGGLGVMSIAVGFAFQDIFENFFAGILLLWQFPFEEGDFIECEGIVGEVARVNVRMTEIRLTSGELVLVPNSMLFKNPVQVLTDRALRRCTIMTGVAYDEDVASSLEIIDSAVHRCETVSRDRPVQVFANAFGASSIDIEVSWWCGSRPVDIRASRSEVVTAVKKALDDAGIEIPFPYRTLTFKEPATVRMVTPERGTGPSSKQSSGDAVSSTDSAQGAK